MAERRGATVLRPSLTHTHSPTHTHTQTKHSLPQPLTLTHSEPPCHYATSCLILPVPSRPPIPPAPHHAAPRRAPPQRTSDRNRLAPLRRAPPHTCVGVPSTRISVATPGGAVTFDRIGGVDQARPEPGPSSRVVGCSVVGSGRGRGH